MEDRDPTNSTDIIHPDVEITHVSRVIDTVTKWDKDKREARSFKELEPDLEAFLNGKSRKKDVLVDVIDGIGGRIDILELSQPRVLQFTDAKDIVGSIEWYSNPTEPLPGLTMEESVAVTANQIRYDVKRLYEARDVFYWLTIGLHEIRQLETGVCLSLTDLGILKGLLHTSFSLMDPDFEPEFMQTLVSYRKGLNLAQDKGCTDEEIEAKIREDSERRGSPGFKLGYCIALFNQIKDRQDGQARANTLTGRRTSMQYLNVYHDKLQSQLAEMGRDFIEFYEGTIKGLAEELGVVIDDGRIAKLKEQVGALEPGKMVGYSFLDLKGIVASLGRALSIAVPDSLKGKFPYEVPPASMPKVGVRKDRGISTDDAITDEQEELNNKISQLFYEAANSELYVEAENRINRLGDQILSLGAAVNEDTSDYINIASVLTSGLLPINQGLELFIQRLVDDPTEILANGFLIRREDASKLGEDLAKQEVLLESLCDRSGNPLPGKEEAVRKAQTEKESIRQLFLYRANFLVAQLYRAKRWYGLLKEIRELSDPAKQSMMNSKIEGLYRRYNRLVDYLNEGKGPDDRLEFWVADEGYVLGQVVGMLANINAPDEKKYRQELETQLALLHDVISVCETLADSRKRVVDALTVQKHAEEEMLEEGNRRFVAGYLENTQDERLMYNVIRHWKRLTRYEEVAGGVKLSDDDVIDRIKGDLLTSDINEPAVRRRSLVYNLEVLTHTIRKYAHLGADVCKSWREFEKYQEEREKLTQAVSSLSEELRASTADKPYNPKDVKANG